MSPIVLTRREGRVRVATPEEFLGWLAAQGDAVACDTETSGLEWEATVRLVQFGNDHHGYAISTTEKAGRALVRQAIREYRGQLIFHNAPFDIRRLDQIGVDPDYIWPRALNTHVMSHVYDPAAPSHKLKDLAKAWLEADTSSEAEMKKRWKKHNLKSKKAKVKWDWATSPRLLLTRYGIDDTLHTYNLATFLEERLSPKELQVCSREYEVAQAVAEVSYKGMQLDVEYALALQERWANEMEVEEAWFAETCGIDNPNADAQLIEVLLSEGWVPKAYTEKSKKPQLDKSVKAELGEYEVIQHLNHYKRIGKWKSAYVDNTLREMDSTGRVHAAYNSLGARTGRMSCSNPPLQQLPRGGGGEVRDLFIAPDGFVLASVDYAAIEMRLAGHFSKDPALIEAYCQGRDIYQEMADFIGCTRAQAKIVCLAALYGSKGKSIARALGCDPEASVRYVSEFWEWSPALSRWALAMTNSAKSGKHVTSKWGRTLAPHAPYAAGNAVIQGTAAEVMKDGILRLAEHGLLQYVVAIVHDEVLLELPGAEAEGLVKQASDLLRDDTFSIPLTTEAKIYGRSWGMGYR